MRILFLAFVFLPFILTVHAQRSFSQYMCQVTYKQSETAFYLMVSEKKQIEVGGWKLNAQIERLVNLMEVSLERKVDIMDASYERKAKRSYPLNARSLPVQLEHTFGGVTDIFNMTCTPRDP